MSFSVYVAGKFEETAAVRAVQQRVRDLGCSISHDWTGEDPAGRTGAELEAFLAGCAQADMDGVLDADLIIVLNHDRLFGGAVEMGMALAYGKIVMVIGPQVRDNIFFHLASGPLLYPDAETCLQALECMVEDVKALETMVDLAELTKVEP